MKIPLRNGYATNDHRLNRIPLFDERSRNFGIADTPIITKRQRSYTWSCDQHLNQGGEGACVGHGIAHELIARPVKAKGIDHQYAVHIYHEAQKIDPWPGGSYPGADPFYEGTSVLSGMKVAQERGWFDEYRWSFNLSELILGVGYNGPAVLGLNWYEGMIETDVSGYIKPTGENVGGHCILCNGVSLKKQAFRLHNSWGEYWGYNGDCFISFEDMERLLYEEGESVFPVGRHVIFVSE